MRMVRMVRRRVESKDLWHGHSRGMGTSLIKKVKTINECWKNLVMRVLAATDM